MLAMLKIWGRATSSNVQKVLWCCAELNIPFDRVDHGGPFGGNRDLEYLKLNPNGLVPTVIDDDLIMWESNTICRYLAATRNGERIYPRDPAARTHVERWMDWQLSVVDGAVADRPYLAGPELSLAEIVLGTQIYRWFTFPIERPAMPKLRAWYDRIRERPGFKTHIELPIT